MAASDLLEYRLAQAEAALQRAENDIEALREDFARDLATARKEIQAARQAEAERERKRLAWGISALGTVVLMLGGVVWSYRSVIFK